MGWDSRFRCVFVSFRVRVVCLSVLSEMMCERNGVCSLVVFATGAADACRPCRSAIGRIHSK